MLDLPFVLNMLYEHPAFSVGLHGCKTFVVKMFHSLVAGCMWVEMYSQ